MPFNLNEFRAKIQFITSASMPHNIYKACLKTGTVSNTRYIQEAVCERLSKDLDVPLETLLGELPAPKTLAGVLFDGTRKVARTRRECEEVD